MNHREITGFKIKFQCFNIALFICQLPFISKRASNLYKNLMLRIRKQFSRLVHSVAIDNGVIGQPQISCGTDHVMFWVKTRNPFVGKVYVKGEYGKPECSLSFNGQNTATVFHSTLSTQIPYSPTHSTSGSSCPPCPQCADGTSANYRLDRQADDPTKIPEMAHLNVKLGTCSLKRDRTLNPAGVQVTFTVVVSFHEHFVTKVDRAYKIQCAYMEADKTVTSAIDVSMQPTEELTAAGTMPQCEYTIRRDSPNGAPVQFAKVGDKVFHRWECTTDMQEMFGMLVHDCFVEDGQGQRVQVLDAKGCSIDQFVLADLTYDTGLLAYVEAHVFKFADRAVLDFQCAMSICVKTDGGCDGITVGREMAGQVHARSLELIHHFPPRCTNTFFGLRLSKRSVVVLETVNKTIAPPLGAVDSANEWQLHAQRFTVVDIDDDIHSDELLNLENELSISSAKLNSPTLNEDPNMDEIDDQNNGRLLYYRRLLQRMGPRVCLSVAGFGVLVSACTFVFTMAAVVIGAVYIHKRRKKD